MRVFVFCIFAAVMLTAAEGEEDVDEDLLLSELGGLECFRCELGFWDACFTTETYCSVGEKCYTGRGRAANVLDVKTLGCAKAEECGAVTNVELFANTTAYATTIYTMTKTCCDTDLCNTARALPLDALLILTGTSISMMLLAAPSLGLQ